MSAACMNQWPLEPPEADMDAVIEQMSDFHAGFMAKYK